MAEFPPNLDDGELWLPYDIFRNDLPSKYISSMDDNLTSHFPAFSLLQNHPPKHVYHSQRLKQAVRYQFPARFWGLDGGAGTEFDRRVYGCGNGATLARFYELRIPLPAGNAYRVHNRALNPVYPIQQTGFGFSGGGGGSGTGVFHPRIVKPSTTGGDIKRKQGVKNEQRNKVGVKKEEECYYHLPPEMGLPKDWTY